MSLKIHSYPNNPRVFKALIAGKYNGVEVEVPSDFVFGRDNKTPEFVKMNPNGKVPVLETPEGPVWESTAIARYVARLNDTGKLFGSSAYENALVDQWIDWTAGEIDLPAAAWLYPILGFVPNNPEATKKARADVRKGLDLLNTHLLTRTFLVGERITLADICVSMSLLPLYKMVLDKGFRTKLVNVNRWFVTCVNQPNFRQVIGDVELCQKMMQAPKVEKKKEEPKKKEAKKDKPAAAKPAAEKPKKKAKNPLDLLPPTKFDLEEWKRQYSNASDTKTGAMPWFWEHYDAEGWSLWFADYKYNEDNTVLFQTCNLIGGYCQRLESLRKYGFGNVLIMGEDKPYQITCAWLVRGTVIPPELSGCPDSELYDFRQCDHTNAADKELLEDIWAWEGKFAGKPSNVCADGKTFK